MPKYTVWDNGEDFSVKRDGNKRSSGAHLSEGKADKLAHHLAQDREEFVEYRGPDGRYKCDCKQCKQHT
jgi:hypothetical protein